MTLSTKAAMILISGPSRLVREDNHSLVVDAVTTYPLTHSQEGIWIDYLVDKTSTQYNLTLELNIACDVEPQIGLPEIIVAIHELTKRHSVLRSTIISLNGKPLAQEHSPNTAAPAIRLLGSLGGNTSEQQVHLALHEPFDLGHEFPVHWYIVQQSWGKQIYLVAHHIALDGGSLALISREILDLLDGKVPVPNQLSESFNQAHSVERAWALTEAHDNAETTCLNQLMGTYPFKWSAAPQQGAHEFRSIQNWAKFSKDDLQGWSSRYSTSWFRVAIAQVGLLLHIETGSVLDTDHMLAVSFAGRPKGFENTVGQFANPLPVKIPIAENFLATPGSEKSTFASFITVISRNVSQVKKAERISLLDLARRWRKNGRLGDFNSPQVAVSYSLALADARCKLFPVEGSWDLFFVFQDSSEGVELGVIYNPKIFNEEAMERMKGTYMKILELSARSGSVSLNELPTMPKHLTIPTMQPPNDFIAVHEMFHMHAISDPNRIALSCAEKKHEMTYGELNNASTLRANVLESHGLAEESVVILHLHRGFHLLEWIIATLTAGGTFVYLDPRLPSDRKQVILRMASGQNSILVTEHLLARDAEWTKAFIGTIVPHLDTAELIIPGSDYITRKIDPKALAYMIFTSGSTGEPKGVMIEHRSFAHFVQSSVPIYRTGHGSRVLQLASFSFDASILEWSSALATGGTLCFADSPQALVGDYLADVIDQNAISFMQTTPSALATIPLHRQLLSLRRISVGGEAISAHLLEIWRDRVAIVNSYGPTERSIAVTFQQYTNGGSSIEQVSVGRPPKDTEIYICDPFFTSILPCGTEVRFVLEARASVEGIYCQRADLTEKYFAIHPTLGIRLYRSGDRGMLLSDGSLVIHGRMDREIKMRGFRIAPEEIESAIVAANAVVLGASVHVSPDGLSLIAVVTPETCSAEMVQQELSKTLPSHMRPSTILPVPSLPITSSGKIDHKAIRENLGSYLEDVKRTRGKPVAPKSPPQDSQRQAERAMNIESFISKTWQEMIGLPEIPSTDVNFFDMGGHSHLVPRLHAQITSRYPSCKVSTLDLFYHSTTESQTRLVCQQLYHIDDLKSTIQDVEAPSLVAIKEEVKTNGHHAELHELTEDRSISIIGISGKFPGADSPDELYKNLTRGVSAIRTSTKKMIAPKDCIWVPQAGTLSGIEEFDAKFWKMTREEAADMDPQQRLFLTLTLQALEDAGIDTFSDVTNNIGVFVGAAANQYHTITDPVYGDPFQRANRGFVAPSISARTAYHLNLHGPNVTINTNCASSTVAMGLAVDALRNHRCDVAVVGGVSVQLYDGGYITQPKSIFSVTGRCRPFEDEADGTVPSDAVVALVLKPTTDATEHGDSAYAQVVGAAYNSDGATYKAGYQVPSPEGQSAVIAAAWKNARLSPEQLQYIELHGSGTPIGDALELEGIKTSLVKIGYTGKTCLVGSNKGTLGNAQHASGLVSLIKICKSIQHGTIPAMVKTGKLNPFIIDANLGIDFAYQPTKIQPEALIGISAAGWGGVNSHIVVRAPAAKLIKKLGNKKSKYTLCNETLAAPRKSSLEKTSTSTSLPNGVDLALNLVIQEVRKIIGNGHVVDAETDLRALGIDSAAFVRLAHSMRNLGKEFTLPVSSFIQPSLTPATLAARLEKAQACAPVWIQLQIGDPNSDRVFILLPPSGGTCAALEALVSAIPARVPVYGLEHPGHSDNLWQQSSYSLPDLAEVYADAVCKHLDTVGSKQVVFIGASFGGVVATEMLHNLFSSPGNSMLLENVKLVLLDAPLSHPEVASGSSGLNDIQPQRMGDQSMIGTSVELVHRSNIHALQLYDRQDATALTAIPVLYMFARGDGFVETNLEKKKRWWSSMFPALQWEELQCTHEQLWREEALEVVNIIQG